MSTSIKKVAIAGAAGALGTVVFDKLVSSGKFEIRVLRRFGSKSTYPSDIEVIDVDFDSVDSLKAAMVGQDAMISTVGYTGLQSQLNLVDAAAAAGVKRLIPSDFGADMDNAKTRLLPVFGDKIKVHEHLLAKSKTTDLTYTLVYNNAFLDWGLERDFVLRISDAKPVIVDGGDLPFSATTLASVADAVVGVLTHPEETKNRSVRVHDIIITQNQLLALAKKAAPEKPWEAVPVKLGDLIVAAQARLAKGIFDVESVFPFLTAATLDPGYGGKFDNPDNELLGVKGVSEGDIVQIIKRILS